MMIYVLAYAMLAVIWALMGINSRLSRNKSPEFISWSINGLLWPFTVPLFCVLIVYFSIKHLQGIK